MARTATLVAIVLAAAALAGCGDDNGGDAAEPGTAQRDVRKAVEGYLAALGTGRAEAICDSLTDQGRKALASFLPSDAESEDCQDVARRVARKSVPLRRARVDRVSVSGSRATARVRSKKPPYESGVLLAKVDGDWLIAYPPGLVEKVSTAPGVPIPK